MPIAFTVDAGEQFVIVRALGVISMADIRSTISSLSRDKQILPGFRMLVDLTRLTWSPGAAEVRTIANSLPSVSGGVAPRIAVAVGNNLHFGIARQVALLAIGREVRFVVAMDMQQAARWVLSDTPERLFVDVERMT